MVVTNSRAVPLKAGWQDAPLALPDLVETISFHLFFPQTKYQTLKKACARNILKKIGSFL